MSTYRCSHAVRDYVSLSVAISPRIDEDLKSTYGFSENRLRFIPIGIDTSAFSIQTLRENRTSSVKLLCHGRIDSDKGVFWLPGILAKLAASSGDWSCTISGDGPNLRELKQQISAAGLSDRVRFTGWTAPEDVPHLMRQHDVFLFPTKYEGYPLALVEAMAGGCAPVASTLPGITDWIIQDGVNGLLFPIGDVRKAAHQLFELVSDRRRLTELRLKARESVSQYSLGWMAEQYYQLLSEVKSGPRQTRPAEDLNACAMAEGMKPAWWYGLPEPIKSRLRTVRERMRTFARVP